ncbi:uncharacterized protein LOC143197960 [Rhynchophorus ferrugineus]|uniref:Uncharacterized protein n=1 Tax=Rhynchophorus ferrugineus TaxID=354439 RepID=A0A834IT81_RHYFE|nr:hypothetical protein GWI33_021805 [Rhynchophorus ferrugineus]
MVRLLVSVFVIGLSSSLLVFGTTETTTEENVETTTGSSEKNNASKDLYVIRKVVYEIGILTEVDENNTEYDNRTHEQVDISFFDPADNGTFIDLSHIPIPVETNVSGVAVTGIVSSNIGNLIFPPNGSVALNESSLPILPDRQVKVTRNITTVDKDKSLNILSGISDVLGLSKLVEARPKEDQEIQKATS